MSFWWHAYGSDVGVLRVHWRFNPVSRELHELFEIEGQLECNTFVAQLQLEYWLPFIQICAVL